MDDAVALAFAAREKQVIHVRLGRGDGVDVDGRSRMGGEQKRGDRSGHEDAHEALPRKDISITLYAKIVNSPSYEADFRARGWADR